MSLAHTLLEFLRPWRDCSVWWLGFSGGLDSTVLLELLCELRQQHQLPELRAVHINHRLSPQAANWQAHCERRCQALGVPLEVRSVDVVAAGKGPEAAARSARYAVFEELLRADHALLLAHHLDDQVETFFLRLMRGAGPRGMSAIPAHRTLARGQLLRPLLAIGRLELEHCAAQYGWSWVDDESNADTTFDRNFLRQQVLPLFEQRWPGYRDSVERARSAVAEAEYSLAAFEQEILAEAVAWYFDEPVINSESVVHMSPDQACRVLRLWLRELGLAAPAQLPLREFVRQLRDHGPQASPVLAGAGYQLRCYHGNVHVTAAPGVPPGDALALLPGLARDIASVGRVELRPAASGIRLAGRTDWQLRFRRGGERCHPVGRKHSQTLKKLLQEYAVPDWWRGRVPLLYAGEELAAVADLWVCEPFLAVLDEPGFTLQWDKPGLFPD
jgi:tRNA(Ile)-lysidine synthase